MNKLTDLEKEVVLRILSSAEDCFGYDEDYDEYTDQGNFVCSLPDINHVVAIKTAWHKIFAM